MSEAINITSVNLYTDRPDGNPVYIYAKQHDKNTRYIKAKIITSEGAYIPAPSSIIQLNCKLPNGTYKDISCESVEEDGAVLFKIDTDILSLAGNVSCDITIFIPADTDEDAKQLTTSSFYITVLETSYSDAAIATLNSSSTLLGLINRVERLYQEIASGIENITPTYVLNWDDVTTSTTALTNLKAMMSAHTMVSPDTYIAYLVVGDIVLRETMFEFKGETEKEDVVSFAFGDLTHRDSGSTPVYRVTLDTTTDTVSKELKYITTPAYSFDWYSEADHPNEAEKQRNLSVYELLKEELRWGRNYSAYLKMSGGVRFPLFKTVYTSSYTELSFVDFSYSSTVRDLYQLRFANDDYEQIKKTYITGDMIGTINVDDAIPTVAAVKDYVDEQFLSDFSDSSDSKGASQKAIVNYFKDQLSLYPNEFFIDLDGGNNSAVFEKIRTAVSNGKAVFPIVKYNDHYLTSIKTQYGGTATSGIVIWLLGNLSPVERYRLLITASDEVKMVPLDIFEFTNSFDPTSEEKISTDKAIAGYVVEAIDTTIANKDTAEEFNQDTYFLGVKTSMNEGGQEEKHINLYPAAGYNPIITGSISLNLSQVEDLISLADGVYNITYGGDVVIDNIPVTIGTGATLYKSSNSIIIVDKDEITKYDGVGEQITSNSHSVSETDFEYRDNVGTITVKDSYDALSFTKGSTTETYWGVLGTEAENIKIETKISQRGFFVFKKNDDSYFFIDLLKNKGRLYTMSNQLNEGTIPSQADYFEVNEAWENILGSTNPSVSKSLKIEKEGTNLTLSVANSTGYDVIFTSNECNFVGFVDSADGNISNLSYCTITSYKRDIKNINVFEAIKKIPEDTSSLVERFKNYKVLCIGDSITEHNFRASKNWVDYLDDWLEFDTPATNDGVSGTGIVTDGAYTNWYDRVSGYSSNYDLILVMGNMNDYSSQNFSAATLGEYGDSTMDTQYGAIKLYLEKLISKFPTSKIGWIISTPRQYSNSNAEISQSRFLWGKTSAFEAASTAIKEVCGDYSVPVLDLYHESNLMPWNDDNNAAYFKPDGEQWGDGVHPNAEGQKIIARKIYDFVVKNF